MRRVVVAASCLAVVGCGGGHSSVGLQPAPPVMTQVAFVVQPSGWGGGQVLGPAVQVAIQDASGNTITTATNRVTLAIGTNPAGGTLSGATTVAAINGVATFSTLSIDKAGTGYTLVASAATLTGATSAAFNVAIGSPAQLVFIVQPSTAAAGQAMTPMVQVAIRDAGGNPVTRATTTVTLALGTHPAGGILSGTVTANAVNGLASFSSLIVNKTGTGYTLVATAGTLTPATSTAFAVTTGPGMQLVFTGEPTTVVAGRMMAPSVQVSVEDGEGNVVPGFVGSVTVALGTNPSAGALSGTLTETTVAGVASFSDLAISKEGNGYTLAASAGALTGTSTPFIVGTTGISYGGGPIITTPKVAALYWSASVIYSGGPTPGTSGAGSADQSLVGFFLRNLGGTPYFNINTTYYDATNTDIQNVLTYTQYWADATAPAALPRDADIQAEIERGFTSGALTYDSSTMYAVFTGTGINLGGGFGTQYCGYHTFFIDALGRNVKYAAMPYDYDYIITSTASGCSLVSYYGTPNNDAPADAEVNVLAHELAETITDENINAWRVVAGGNAGAETGDLCNFTFGTMRTTGNRAAANQSLGGKDFLVQMLWVNMETSQGTPVGCQQSWTTPASVLAHRARAPSRLLATPILATRSLAAAGRHVMRMSGPGQR